MAKASKDKNIAKAKKLEDKGDLYRRRNQHQKAFKAYQQALDLDESRLTLYDKIISLHKEYSQNWTEEDFAYNLWLTMKRQEIENPVFKRIHARSDPEFKEVRQLITKMLKAKTDNEETKIVEKIAAFGQHAIYPLIDFILGFKQISRQKKE